MKWNLFNKHDPPGTNQIYLIAVTFSPDEIDWDLVTTLFGRYDGEKWVGADSQDIFQLEDDEVLAFMDVPTKIKNVVDNPSQYGSYLVSVKYGGRMYYRTMIGTYYKGVWSVGDLRKAFELYEDNIIDIKISDLPVLSESDYNIRFDYVERKEV